jgi:excisionase family DNA binding protein
MPPSDVERRPVADYIKLPEVARRLDVSEKTARRMVKAGKLPAVFIGGAYRVSEEDLAGFLESSKVDPGKAQRRSSLEPSLNDALEEERRAAWEAAVDEAQRLRETGWAQMWRALSEWRASKQRGETYAARRKYLDEMGNLLQDAYGAYLALGNAYMEAALTQGGSEAPVPRDLQKKTQAAHDLYVEMFGLVRSAGLSIRTGDDAAAAKQEAAEGAQSKPRPHSVVEDVA